ncbi:S-adenosyl-L-methionine-dependent methyltransferase [Vararia minispora EC-137]|uniref:S-adenosyl-L-methionine-dependent methyltransferase n=1 Tax=Vararia minispora EC-137 TaxID=1314806 RepID=A0ACB8QCY7_9AGAM|nr:S-adenosyl-L-methionine-dependent methyltransferase [Vararia minispora EC-137]
MRRAPVYYHPPQNALNVQETADTLLPGEDLEAGEAGVKRRRFLTNFAFISPRDEKLLPLNNSTVKSGLEAVGEVGAYEENSEDAGQEDYDLQTGRRLSPRRLRTTPIIRMYEPSDGQPERIETMHAVYVLGHPSTAYKLLARPRKSASHTRPLRIKIEYDKETIDNKVLKAENQVRTVTTRAVQRETQPFFVEVPYLVDGDNLPQHTIRSLDERLPDFLDRARQPANHRRAQRRRQGQHGITIDGVIYEVGDTVVILRDRLPDTVPDDAQIEDYFQFAEILYFDTEWPYTAHVRYLAHSSSTAFVLTPITDPRELFLTTYCGMQNPSVFCGKVNVRKHIGTDEIPDTARYYFTRYLHHPTELSFVDLPRQFDTSNLPGRHFCPSCDWLREHDRGINPRVLQQAGIRTLRARGIEFHVNDYVLFKNVTTEDNKIGVKEVGIIGCIRDLRIDQGPADYIDVVLFERQVDHPEGIPDRQILDERELLSTDRLLKVPVEHIVSKVYVKHAATLNDSSRDAWIAQGPDRFIREEFARDSPPLRVLDLFAGTGSMSLGLIEGFQGRMELTHAVEISPSAASSLKKYSPSTKVFNQCANLVLSAMHRTNTGARHDPAKDNIVNLDGSPFEQLPRAGDIDVICVGVPCQPHSRLNRFPQPNDAKSNLILTLLGFLDLLRPKYIFFENVQGFLSYEVSPAVYPPPPGDHSTGLRLLMNMLLKLGYQVRPILLNAAHFGAPQMRTRFFFIAARAGEPMPLAPYPTHAFDSGRLEIRTSKKGDGAGPIHPVPGTFMFKHWTVEEAIGDLWAFDSHNPGIEARKPKIPPPTLANADRALLELRGDGVAVAFPPEKGDEEQYLKCPKAGYAHLPRTTYQQRARAVPTSDLQHYTTLQKSGTTELICNIPMTKDADFRKLPEKLYRWQLQDPQSATARHGFRTRFFWRLDPDDVFQTIITNVSPTAKQSRVLHPYSHRMVTVRELARAQGFPDSYVFVSLSGSILHIHKQIGNAVPWQVSRALGRELFKAIYEKELGSRR